MTIDAATELLTEGKFNQVLTSIAGMKRLIEISLDTTLESLMLKKMVAAAERAQKGALLVDGSVATETMEL